MTNSKTLQKIELKIGDYAFSFKRFHYEERMSEETNCFVADLLVNGKKFATCDNNGHGESTNVRPLPECIDIWKEIVTFLALQPKVKCEGYDFEMDCDLEYVADTLTIKHLETKEFERIMKMTKDKLVFKDANGNYYSNTWGKLSIETMLKDEHYREEIRKAIKLGVQKNRTLMNRNIPEELMK